MNDSFEIIEKRRYLRLADNFRVELVPWNAPKSDDPKGQVADKQDTHVAFSRDLSLGGLCVVTADALSAGALVEALVHAAELKKPLSVVGEIVRVSDAGNGRHEVALRFVPHWIDEEVRLDLERLIYEV